MKSVMGAAVFFIGLSAQSHVEVTDLGYLPVKEQIAYWAQTALQMQNSMDCSNLTVMNRIGSEEFGSGQKEKVPGQKGSDRINLPPRFDPPLFERPGSGDNIIINIGRAIWSVIEKGQPIIQEKYNIATALPAGTKCWTDLSRWKRPTMKRFEYKFFAGTSHTKISLVVVAVTGGSKNGKGKYIAYASAYAESIKNLGLMNKLNINVEVPAVYNEGDENEDVGAMLMNVKVANDATFIDRTDGKTIVISGKGTIELQEASN
jgi:hypothetical protein